MGINQLFCCKKKYRYIQYIHSFATYCISHQNTFDLLDYHISICTFIILVFSCLTRFIVSKWDEFPPFTWCKEMILMRLNSESAVSSHSTKYHTLLSVCAQTSLNKLQQSLFILATTGFCTTSHLSVTVVYLSMV